MKKTIIYNLNNENTIKTAREKNKKGEELYKNIKKVSISKNKNNNNNIIIILIFFYSNFF